MSNVNYNYYLRYLLICYMLEWYIFAQEVTLWENQDSEIIILENQGSIASTNLTNRSYSSLFLILVTIVLICFIPTF